MVVSLTPRQQQVLNLVLTGMSDQEIADELHVSLSTVKSTMRLIRNKLPVSVRPTRAAMSAWYVEWRCSVKLACARAVVKDPSPKNINNLAEALKI